MLSKILLPLCLVLLLVGINVQAFSYDITYWANSTQGATGTATPPSFQSDQANSINLIQNIYLTFNLTSSPDSYTANYLTPYSVTEGQAIDDLTANYSCLNIGGIIKDYSVGEVETRATISQDGATTSFITVGSRNIISNSNRYLTLDKSEEDTEAGASNIYARTVCEAGGPITQANVYNRLNSDNFGECLTNSLRRIGTTYALTCPSGFPKEFIYMVFNSSAGNVSFSTEIFNSGSGNQQHLLYKFDEPTTIIDSCSSVDTCSGTNQLSPNTLYVIGVGTLTTTGVQQTIDINVTIDTAEPDYQCTQAGVSYPCDTDTTHCYGICDETTGKRTRTCTDVNGFQPQKPEIQDCSLIILENATLGFENSTTVNTILKCQPQWFPIVGCFYEIANVTLDRPGGDWLIVDPAYGDANFLQMTQEFATEGTRSLKMWQIPPKQGEVIDASTCGNLTSSVIPTAVQVISNSTFSVVHNVTFPAENMQISFDVKKCNNQVLQHSALMDEGIFFNVTFCNQRCYANDCSAEPKGGYVFNIVDPATTLSIFGAAQYEDAQLNTLSPTYDLSNLGIKPGHPYFLVFAISNENPNDATGTCVYFDNVRYEVTGENPFLKSCKSQCVGSRRIEASRTLNGSCFTVDQDPSPLCSDQATADAIENQENYCSSSSVLQTFIEKSAQHEPISCSEGFVCDPFPVQAGTPGSCITEAEAKDQPTTESDSITLINEIFAFMATRLFWAMAITGIFFIMTLIATAKLGEVSWIGASIISIMSLVFFIAIGWVALEVGALIVLPVALLIVYEFRKAT